ncbi:SDR family oxidoreductase [Dactylosporangium sp. NPDC049525]|uniref:SDR family oxidoreductase n=1 Tax=Dactylosporangium sp. NPDC049525 TaxID=3154730 RepID=UPI003427057F
MTGASRGFGLEIARALAADGHDVVGVSRGPEAMETADASAPGVAEQLIAKYRPSVVVLNAGVVPHTGPLHEQTWETFSQPWEVDVRQAFQWARAALLAPLDPGSLVVAMSSGAALAGSPMSGGYAGAKATVRFVARYAAEESARRALGIRFVALLPSLSPSTAVGGAGVRAYAGRQGIDVSAFVAAMDQPMTPDLVGAAVAELVAGGGPPGDAYTLSSNGLKAL